MGFTNDSMLLYVICLFSPMLFNSEFLNGVKAILLWSGISTMFKRFSSSFYSYHLLINSLVINRDEAILEFALPQHVESADSSVSKGNRNKAL